jgi:hypothetical protein
MLQNLIRTDTFAVPQLPLWGKNTDKIKLFINNFAIMWRLSGELFIQLNFPIIANIGNSLNEHGGNELLCDSLV